MAEYVKILGIMTIGIDIVLLLLMAWCLFRNGKYLLESKGTGDESFRFILFCQSLAFIYANIKALQRHLDSFIYAPMSHIDLGTVRNLIQDRGFMLLVAVCILLLTVKYRMVWYRNK